MWIHSIVLRSASQHWRRKMKGVDAGMQGIDDRMQPAYRLVSLTLYSAPVAYFAIVSL